MTGGATVRLLTSHDIEPFKRIRLEALRQAPEAFASRFEDWEPLADEEWRRRLTANPVLVAFEGDEPIGIMGLMRQQSSKMAHRASIIMVYVRAGRRGSGIATLLLDRLVGLARQTGIRQLELAVTVENEAAHRFYVRQGFQDIGRIPGGFLHDGREIDEILMSRRL